MSYEYNYDSSLPIDRWSVKPQVNYKLIITTKVLNIGTSSNLAANLVALFSSIHR